MRYVLQTNSLTKKYKNFQALNGLTMNVPEGSVYGFVGKNGAGKTTLIRLICGLQEPSSGDFTLYGIQSGSRDMSRARRRMGAVVETPAVYMDMTAEENLKQQYLILGLPSYDGIPGLLKLVGLEDTGKKKVKNFSMGMKQRLGIAMALLGSPKLLILDEPTNGLDPAGIQEMRSLIASMPQTTGATVLISSHLLGEIEQMVDQVGILNHGRLLFEGSLQQLQKHSRGGILLRVLDVSNAAAVLQRQGVKAAAPADQPDTLQLPPLPDEALAALVCTLAESGVGVVGLTAQTKSLEDIFLSLTQTSGEVA